MDAKEFIRTHKRMCKKYHDVCEGCPLLDKGCYSTSTSIIFPEELDENIVDLVEKWAKENPIKTRQSKFLEMFPNASVIANGTLGICPRLLDKDYECFYHYLDCDGEKVIDCLGCRNQFWLEEVDE